MKDKVQLIKEEIESYKESMKGLEPHSDFRRGQITAYNQIMQFINSLPEEHNEDLEEAAYNYCEKVNHRQTDIITDSFKAGAEWQKQQIKEALQTEYEKGRFDMREEMMKDAVDAFVNTYENTDDSNYVEFVTEQSPYKFKETEKCKLIIIKEE